MHLCDKATNKWQQVRMVQHNSLVYARMTAVTHPRQYFSQTDHV